MAEQPQTSPSFDAALAEHIRAAMRRWTVPGAAVGILTDGVREEQRFGVVSLETGYPTRADTLFQIGSITKLFTTMMVMLLVEEGKLALDTQVINYLPEFALADKDAQAHMTVRMLLTHSGGFYGDLFDDTGPGDDALSLYLKRLPTAAQQTPAGTSWAYNNAGFVVAGALIERMTGKPYEQVIREHIFTPLGMRNSFFFAHEAIAYPNAVGHTQATPGADEHVVARLYPLPRSVNAAGGIISNVDDLLTFAQFYIDGGVTRDGARLLSEETVHSLWRPQIAAANFVDAYGIGWQTQMLDGQLVVGHGGSTNGFNAVLVVVPERKFALAVLTNSERGSAMYREVEEATLAERLGLHAPKRTPITLPAEELQRFAGVYRRPDGTITLTVEGETLRREVRAEDLLNHVALTYPPTELRPLSATDFIVVTPGEHFETRMDFLLHDDGRPRYLRMGGRLAERVDDAAEDQEKRA